MVCRMNADRIRSDASARAVGHAVPSAPALLGMAARSFDRSRLSLFLRVLLAWVFATGVASSLVAADAWPHRLGPTRNGYAAEPSGWNGDAWLPVDPTWTVNVGRGASSPIVAGECVFTMGWKDGEDFVRCLHPETGAVRWESTYPAPEHARYSEGDKERYAGPTSTPEYDPETGYLYTLSSNGDLNCWSTERHGDRVWGVNLYDKFNVQKRPRVGRSGSRDYGYTTSPLVLGDQLIVEVGARQGNLVSFDKRSGKRLWRSKNRDPAGHTGGPVAIEAHGVRGVAVLTLHHLLVVRVDGKQRGHSLAEYPWATSFGNNIATPVVDGNHVLVTSGYNHDRIVKFEITLAGAYPVWERPYSSGAGTPVVHDGHVYWAWQRLRCLDLRSGHQKWEGGKFGDAGSVIVTSDEKLIVWGGAGILALVETVKGSPDAYTQLDRRAGLATTDVWPQPALAAGRLYLRDRVGNLQAFELGDVSSSTPDSAAEDATD